MKSEERTGGAVVGRGEEPGHGPYWAGGGVSCCHRKCAGCSVLVCFGGLDGDAHAISSHHHVPPQQVSGGGVPVGSWCCELTCPQEGVKTKCESSPDSPLVMAVDRVRVSDCGLQCGQQGCSQGESLPVLAP